MKKYLPNMITLFRLFLIPPILWCLLYPGYWRLFSLFLFTICSISDWLDGYLARKFNVFSKFGKFLDPLVDKFLLMSIFIIFIYVDPTAFSFWLIWLIGVREFVVTAIRIYAIYDNKSVDTLKSGKIKTIAQFVAIYILYTLFILKDIMALYINKYTSYFHSSLEGAKPIWQYIFGVYGPQIILSLPNIALTVVTLFTLYSGFFYVKKHINFFYSKY